MEAIVSSDSRRRLMGPRRTVRGGLLDHAWSSSPAAVAAISPKRKRAMACFGRHAGVVVSLRLIPEG